jgi:hypothetical protein
MENPNVLKSINTVLMDNVTMDMIKVALHETLRFVSICNMTEQNMDYFIGMHQSLQDDKKVSELLKSFFKVKGDEITLTIPVPSIKEEQPGIGKTFSILSGFKGKKGGKLRADSVNLLKSLRGQFQIYLHTGLRQFEEPVAA